MILASRPLRGTRFAEAWLSGNPGALALLQGAPHILQAYRDKAQEVDSRFTEADREWVAGQLTGGGPEGEERKRAFIREGGFLVTTGQQPGLFGGPLFALYKAATAAALARRLQIEIGRPVLPAFWIASEHHLWDEVARIHVLDRGNELREVVLPLPAGAAGRPVHRVPLGPEIRESLREFLALHPESDFLPKWRELLEEGYAPGRTLPQGFEAVMDGLLADSGVYFLSAHGAPLKERSLPILLRELEESAEREKELGAFEARVRAAGFDPQVPILPGATNLFFEGAGGRERLFTDGDGYRLRGSESRISKVDLGARVSDDPSLLSPNVLLRPVVEAALLPTLSYVAGPGEMAYLPQAEPLFRAHGIGRPVVHPRAALFVLEGKVTKVMEKFGLTIEDLSLPPQELTGKLVREEMPPEVEQALGTLRTGLASGGREIESAAAAIDPTLRGPVEAFASQSAQGLQELERKILQSLRRQNEVTLGQAAKAQLHLFPLGRPQERVLNPFYYLIRYDAPFLAAVKTGAEEVVLP